MLKKFSEILFGSRHEQEMKRLKPYVVQINALEPEIKAMSDDQLRSEIVRLRDVVIKSAEGATDRKDLVRREEAALAEVLPRTFAIVREASVRVLGMRHYDVQLIGGMVLHGGRISEMKTGEGKTLVATLPMVLNSLTGRGVHLVTVNDYLARRDSEWMGRIYKFLGLSVGLIVHGLSNMERRSNYGADITYGTNNEFGFDYLRDNMKFHLEDYCQRDLHYAIVDEVDSILIDEARTPLIISGSAEQSTDLYYSVNGIIKNLVQLGLSEGKKKAEKVQADLAARGLDEDPEIQGLRGLASTLKGKKKKEMAGDYYYFSIDEKGHNVILSEEGVAWVEKNFHISNLYEPQNIELLHHVNQAMRAHLLYRREDEYIVQDGKVVIVDEFTGRLMPGRRWSDGLHQAIEAKEGVTIEEENQTLASITFQNYFRMYDKLAGMTGTAETEAEEFRQIYGLDVVAIPTHNPMVRKDHPDFVYRTQKEKYNAVVEEIVERHGKGQPVLVGTITIENSEKLSAMLKKRGVKHNVLNAKFHEKEAEIVAQAGRKNAVTIATNMAGRGTDIVLGGNPEFLAWGEVGTEAPLEEFNRVLDEYKIKCKEEKAFVIQAGGLHILGTERHESRRIDNQLRGRSGRQGDPGSSRFYLSLEDDLMRIFGGDRIKFIMDKIGVQDGEVIEHAMISRAIEKAQKRVEAHNFDIRKNLLEYDTVMNEQRTTIYKMRREILEGKDQEERVLDAIEDSVITLIGNACQGSPDKWDLDQLEDGVKGLFNVEVDITFDPKNPTTMEAIQEHVYFTVEKAYKDKVAALAQLFGDNGERWSGIERELHLQILDKLWRDHLLSMDHLKEGIGLRGYGKTDPKQEYKKEGFSMFSDMLARISEGFVRYVFHVQIQTEEEVQRMQQKQREDQERRRLQMERAQAAASAAPATQQRKVEKIGRNDPCPCGSGQKFKRCHWGKAGYEKFM